MVSAVPAQNQFPNKGNVHSIKREKEKIPDSFLRDLISRVDIVGVIESSVPLKKNGANFNGCCPFHKEKTPSFSVSPVKQFYHCFGCGVSGDAIKFLTEYKGMAFMDAVKELADSVGMSIPKECASSQPSNDRVNPVLVQRMRDAREYYISQLLRNVRALAYLLDRGITPLTAVRFGIGYAPADWQNLQSAFGDYEAVELQLTGLVVKNQEGKHYDRFRDRIMFPIHGANGDVIGFGGRVINPEDAPKYLNSPATPLFDKGSELFGLPQAAPVIRETGCVIVVEGYMDATALSEAGIGNVVATLGTASTPVHSRKLFRMADKVYFCFDGDDAGRKAAWRAMENALPFVADNKSAFFVFLPNGEDPDSFIRKNKNEDFFALCDKAMPLSDYLIRALIERNQPESAEGRAKLIFEARPLMAKIKVPQAELLRLQMLKQLSSVTQFTVAELNDLCPAEKSH